MRKTIDPNKTDITECGVRLMSTLNFSTLKLLAIFVTVVESGSFASAARKLSSSRSRISEQVTQLEQILGVRLLQRSTRQLNMTTDGQSIYQQARQLPDILKAIECQTIQEEPSGPVSISMNHDIAHRFLLPRLQEFLTLYPKIQLDLILDDEKSDLIANQIDLAIRIGHQPDDSLIARPMHEERFALFASPDYLTQYGTPNSLRTLEEHRWITLKQPNRGNLLHLQEDARPIKINPQYQYRCNSPLMIQQMLKQGLGIGAMLPSTVRQEIKQGALVPVMPTISSETMVFSLIYLSRRQLPNRIRVVIDYLLNANVFSDDW
jgi:DNA-binding transcriptional LysR family regulator